jgi:hypothetical protein
MEGHEATSPRGAEFLPDRCRGSLSQKVSREPGDHRIGAARKFAGAQRIQTLPCYRVRGAFASVCRTIEGLRS